MDIYEGFVVPKVSVLMPIYQTSDEYLREAIDSILAQSYKDYEFIILNDSPENPDLKAMVESYTDIRIRYYENSKNLGIAGSYNRLLELATCEYVAMMNHDDISHPDRIKLQVEYMDAHPEIGALGTAFKKFGEINRFKTVINKVDDASIRSLFLFKVPLHHPTVMFRRKLIIENNIHYNTNYISLNDRQFFYDISKVSKLANLPQVLYKYRFHPQMASKIFKPEVFVEKCNFHTMWLDEHNIKLSGQEKYILDYYATYGRCQIREYKILKQVVEVLNKINDANKENHFLPEAEFADACSHYLVKRCLNAALYGKFASTRALLGNTIPMDSKLVKLCNILLAWRQGEL